MSTTTANQGIILPETTDADNVPYVLAQAVGGIEPRLVMRFTSTTQRDSKIPSPVDGMTCHTAADDNLWVYNGAKWVLAVALSDLQRRPGYQRAVRSTDVAVAAGASYTVAWETSSNASGHPTYAALTSSGITVPTAGLYLATLSLDWAPTAGGRIAARMLVGGAAVPGGVSLVTTTTGNTHVVQVTLPLALPADAVVGGSIDAYSGAGTLTNANLVVAGPIYGMPA